MAPDTWLELHADLLTEYWRESGRGRRGRRGRDRLTTTVYRDHLYSVEFFYYCSPAWKFTNCWNTAVNTRCTGHTGMREDLAARWLNFFRSLITGPSPEVVVVARLAAADACSTTYANNRYIFSCLGISGRPRPPR